MPKTNIEKKLLWNGGTSSFQEYWTWKDMIFCSERDAWTHVGPAKIVDCMPDGKGITVCSYIVNAKVYCRKVGKNVQIFAKEHNGHEKPWEFYTSPVFSTNDTDALIDDIEAALMNYSENEDFNGLGSYLNEVVFCIVSRGSNAT